MPNIKYKKIWVSFKMILLTLLLAGQAKAQTVSSSSFACCVNPNTSSVAGFTASAPSYNGNTATLNYTFTAIVSTVCSAQPVNTWTISFGDQSTNYSAYAISTSTVSGVVYNTFTASHTYTLPNVCAPAVYSLNIDVSNESRTFSCNKTYTITVPHPASTFSITKTYGSCTSVSFSPVGTSPLLNAQWIYGNNVASSIMSTATSTTYIYPAAGVYTAYLTGEGIAPCTVSTQVNVQGPVSDFTYSVINSCSPSAGVALSISNYSSTGVTYSFQINGNALISTTAANSTITSGFIGGINTINLVVSNGTCSSTITKTVSIGAPANYAINATNTSCKTFNFNYTGSPALSNTQWAFGDGNFSPIITNGATSITHAYAGPGVYVVSLSGIGINPCQLQTTVNVSDFTLADFSYTLNNLCDATAGIILSIPNYSAGYTYQWQINSLFVNCTGASGTYFSGLQNGGNIIKLIITNASGCTTSTIKVLNIGSPPASFSQYTNNVCVGDPLSIYALSPGGGLYTWTITNSGGTSNLTGMNPAYNFTAVGINTIALTITSTVSANGQTAVCTSTYVTTTNVNTLPDATFIVSPLQCGNSLTLALTNPTTAFTSYSISYGDGSSFTGGSSINSAHLSHTFSTINTNTIYVAQIILFNGPCTSTFNQNIVVNNNSSLVITTPEANFCAGNTTNINSLVNSSIPGVGPFTYSWSGPGSFVSSAQNINVGVGGNYSLTVTSTGSCPLVLTGTKSVTSVSVPTVAVAGIANITCISSSGSATLTLPNTSPQGFLVNGQSAPPVGTGSTYSYTLTGLVQGNNNIVIANPLNTSCATNTLITITKTEPSINLTVTQPVNCSPGTGSANMSASPSGGTTYWYTTANYPAGTSTTGASVSGLPAGSYVLKYVDNNCVLTSNFSINTPVINLSKLGGAGTCSNAATGVTINTQYIPQSLTGTFSYSIVSTTTTTSGASNTFSLVPGSYTAVVTSNGGCSASLPFTIGTIDPLKASLVTQNPTCKDPGNVTAVASGGDGNYTYQWYWNGMQNSNISSVQTLTALTAQTTISVTVKDGSGCTTSGVSYSVSVSPATTVSLLSCGGFGNASATNTTPCYISTCLQGGNPNYLFEWYNLTPVQQTVQWNFKYNSAGTFVAVSGTNVVVVPVPTSTANLYLGNNTDFSVTTAAYPYWNFTLTPGTPVPVMNPVGIASATANTSTDSTFYYSLIETITTPSARQFVTSYSGPSGAPGSIEKFKTGIYELDVTDALGCKYTFSIGAITIPEPTTFHIAFDFVFGMGKIAAPEPDTDPVLHENMIEAADELLDQASACAIKKTKQLLSYLNQDCGNLNNIRDELVVSYPLNDHHYTLYYYDRAGRLTKTVPPQGVELVSQANVSTIKTNRSGNSAPGSWPTLTPHRMATTYQYNSFGQLISQTTPDGGTTNFIYDAKNRLRFSQNDKQKNTGGYYSYTKYDSLGRIVEVGQSQLTGLNFTNPTLAANTATADILSFPQATASGANNKQITTTVYSATTNANYYGKPQRYLQNRVSYTAIDEDPTLSGDEHYTYYSYDSHGNVEWLIQDNPGGLGKNYIAYEYDLVSGKVKKVKYNEKRGDRFFHRYQYDSENRLVLTETSRNGELWDRDADYSYYPHGPLKRTLIGEDHVQGLDYIYTIHGWIKSINSPNLSTASDPAVIKDNDVSYTPGSGKFQDRTAADRFGMVLNYYTGDYVTNTNNFLKTTTQYSLAAYSATSGAAPSLYNGNISGWIQSQLDATATTTLAARADLFQYDVLNRIKQSTSVKEDATNSTWTSLTPGANTFKTEYTYDRNGNILNLKRSDDQAAAMDDLSYTYDNGSMGAAANKNRLSSVQDAIGTTVTGRQDFQDTHNYTYDDIGNLIKETGKEYMAVGTSTVQALRSFTTDITWTVYGKIKEIQKQTLGGSTNYKERITFQYDASGNRVKKEYWKDSYSSPDGAEQPQEITITYYVRDAQGNTLGTYQRYYDIGNNVYKIDLTEQPIYGSDRIGQNVEKVTLASASSTTNLVLPGNGITAISEYQNWITSTAKTSLLPTGASGSNDNLCQCKVVLMNNSGSNPNYNNVQNAVEMLGIANNGVAVAEDLQRNLQFYVVLAKNYLGSNDACLVFDKDGKLMAGSEMIGKVDVNSKPVVINLPNSSKYAIVTLSATTKQAMYHVVDMSQVGYGPIANSGSVISVNNPLDNTMAAGKTHNYHFTGVEDHTAGHSIVYAGRFTQDPNDINKGTTDIMAYDFGTSTVTPTAFTVSSQYGCATTEEGQFQISPDGNKLAWWRYDQYLAGFAYKTGEVRTYSLSTNRTSSIGSPTLQSISPAGNYGNGMLDFMANSKDILYSQRGVYKEGSGTTKYDRNVWRYDPVNLPSYVINPNTSPLISYLFGEIKRGIDGNYYIPNMGKGSQNIHSYNGTNYNNYSYPVDTMYKLASSLPTQVYKVFDNNTLIKDFVRSIGNKDYELKDHLGNVRVVLSDAKIIWDANTNSTIDAADLFTPDVQNYSDYYAFGQPIPGRQFNSSNYRHGFNGQEKDDEIAGSGNIMTTEYWEYDSRLGKRWNVDPVVKTFESPYLVFFGNPIKVSDPSGADGVGDPQGNITATVYVKFDSDASGMSATEQQAYINNVRNNIVNTWNSFQTSDGNKANANNVQVLMAPDGMTANNLTANQNLITVGNGVNADPLRASTQTSYVFGDKANQGYFFLSNNGGEAAHEFGHMLGLSDRYAEGAWYQPNHLSSNHGLTGRFNVPLMFSPEYDPSYDPYHNLMSVGGGGLSSMQTDLIFDGKFNKEKTYASPCLIQKSGSTLAYQSIKVSRGIFGIKVTPYIGMIPNNNYTRATISWARINLFGSFQTFGTSSEEPINNCKNKSVKEKNRNVASEYSH